MQDRMPDLGRPDCVTFVRKGFRDIIWCYNQNEPATISYRRNLNGPICDACGADVEALPESHPFLAHILKPIKERNVNIKPLQDKIVIKLDKPPEKTESGLFIPDTVKEPPIYGTVIAAGEGRILENGKVVPNQVKTGDRVLTRKYAGTEIKINGEDLVMVKEEDVLGVVEE